MAWCICISFLVVTFRIMTSSTFQVWFQNRRTKWKRQRNCGNEDEDDEEDEYSDSKSDSDVSIGETKPSFGDIDSDRNIGEEDSKAFMKDRMQYYDWQYPSYSQK